MSQKFVDGIHDKTNKTRTEKGAVARRTTNSDLLDLFAMGGALRKRPKSDITRLFDKGFSENKEIATKLAFYIRDIRGPGLGERRTFRVILDYLARQHPSVIEKNLTHVPFYGRWDDLYALFDTPLERPAAKVMYQQLQEDLDADQPSLLAKWLKSENASSDETRRLARKTLHHFGMSPREYRKTLSKLRERIKVVEKLMSEKRWDEIDFERVPSRAASIYKDAFKQQCPVRYTRYLEKLEDGEAKINASALFPYDIIREVLDYAKPSSMWGHSSAPSSHELTVWEEQWKALPEYDAAESGALCVVDTSGSMFLGEGLPAAIALSLGIYFGERNEGPFADKFITFSNAPVLQKIRGSDIYHKVDNMADAEWDGTTNLEAVFDLILDTAIENTLSQDELPEKLIIISDMEFDFATTGFNTGDTFMQTMEKRFQRNGYDIPFLVFWNVDSRNDQVPMSLDDNGFLLVSGASQSVFEAVTNCEATDPYDLMVETVTQERYDRIEV